MPEGGERTEAPTPRWLQQIRHRGDVARSTEVTTAVGLLAAALTLRVVGPTIVDGLEEILKTALLHPNAFSTDPDAVRFLSIDLVLKGTMGMAPLLLAIMVAGIFSNLIQVGGMFTPSHIAPKYSRVDPLAGLRRLFSLQGLVELGKSAIKLIVIAAVIYQTISGEQGRLLMLLRGDVVGGFAWFADLSADVMVRVGVVFLVLSGADYLFQRWQFMRQAKMTREQLKEEMRSTEGSPEMRQRMRQAARTLAMSRMMQAVPTADVVITNPTHLAVAIKYEMGSRAPKVIAKGPNLLAERIKQIARNAGVPIVENRPLAQALYKAADVGAEIPAALYQVVAEILAFVYRLRAPRMRFA
ncbi:MAG: flagellar biosynthesis protein FlhB [Chloroflexi bacterium]|nr:flagellar biosynthesis protein FlhB [Chloroflexota bacterium]